MVLRTEGRADNDKVLERQKWNIFKILLLE